MPTISTEPCIDRLSLVPRARSPSDLYDQSLFAWILVHHWEINQEIAASIPTSESLSIRNLLVCMSAPSTREDT
jgi:hypothetical protein